MNTMSASPTAGGDPVALRFVQRQAVIGLVHHGAAVEFQRGLAGPDQRVALHHGQRGGVRHVGVKRRPGARNAGMQPGVDVEGGILRHAVAGHDVAVEVADQQARGGDFGERPAVRVDQEQVVPARNHERQMVADALVQAHPGGGAEAGGEVHARLPDVGAVEVGVSHDRRCAHAAAGLQEAGRWARCRCMATNQPHQPTYRRQTPLGHPDGLRRDRRHRRKAACAA